MFIDCSKLPDPANPQPDDVYTTVDASHTLVVGAVGDGITTADRWVEVFIDGTLLTLRRGGLFAPLLASIGARPWGQLNRSTCTRPGHAGDPELVTDRLVAFGPHLRALREQYGLSMGDLARALGCPPARLSMLELGVPDPVRESAGVREDEGRAALAELLTSGVERALESYLLPDPPRDTSGKAEEPSPARVVAWETIHNMLATEPAHAAISTIMRARCEAQATANLGTSAWDVSQLDPERAAQRVLIWLSNDGLVEPSQRSGLLAALTSHLGKLKASHKPTTVDNQVFRERDRVRVDGRVGNVKTVEHDNFMVLVEFTDGSAPDRRSFADVQLANENVAIETARAGLGLHLARAVLLMQSGLSESELEGSHEQQQIQATITSTLATDEAQRLIRLHG